MTDPRQPVPVHVVDAHAAVELARRGYVGDEHDHELYAPTLLRSQVLSIVRADVVARTTPADEALELAERACRLPRRLLGDAVLRATAWRLAADHDWPDTFDAEYVALTRLHGESLVAGSETLRARAQGIVTVRTVDELVANGGDELVAQG